MIGDLMWTYKREETSYVKGVQIGWVNGLNNYSRINFTSKHFE
jgi:hypothetical protein